MNKNNPDILDRIDQMVSKLQTGIVEQSSLNMDAYPGMTKQEARELYILNKIATLTIVIEDMEKKIEK